jgi:hypothetical protein
MISDSDFTLKINLMSDYMLNVYNEVNQTNAEVDIKANNMIVLIGVMITLLTTRLFYNNLKADFIIILISMFFYFLALILLVYSYRLKKFSVTPNSDQLIDYGKTDDVSPTQMNIYLACDLNEAIKHNAKISNKKAKFINYSMYLLVLGVFSTMINIIFYLIG